MKKVFWKFVCIVLLCTSCRQNPTIEIDSFDVVRHIMDYDSIYSDKESPSGIITAINVCHNMIVAEHGSDEQFFLL